MGWGVAMMRLRLAAVIPLCLVASACTGAQSVLSPAGEQADSLFSLLQLMVWVCGAIYALVLLFLGWSMVRIWRRSAAAAGEAPEVDPADRGLNRSMMIWAAVIVASLTVLITASFLADRHLASLRQEEVLLVRVTGHQWWWRIEYRDPATGRWIETANELHLPVGRTARVELGSADVIHSFWVPNVAGKMDVIPGRANSIDMTPRRTGWFRGQCAEFCGVQHTHMSFDVKVESAAEFRRWLDAQARPAAPPRDPVLARGAAIVTEGACALCHAVRGTPAVGRPGPDLTHVGSRRSLAAGTLAMSRGALQGWIANPKALKPGTTMPTVPLSAGDANAVAAYLETLR